MVRPSPVVGVTSDGSREGRHRLEVDAVSQSHFPLGGEVSRAFENLLDRAALDQRVGADEPHDLKAIRAATPLRFSQGMMSPPLDSAPAP